MTNDKASINLQTPDLEALASEVCDMWQDYFSALASGAASKADLTQLLEPQRRMFADFMVLMQHGADGKYPNSAAAYGKTYGGKSAGGAAASGAPAAAFASDDGALRLAQLAHRVAELEKRLAKLEQGSGGRGSGAAAKAPRPRGKPAHE